MLLLFVGLSLHAEAQNLPTFPDHTIHSTAYDYVMPGWRLFAYNPNAESFANAGTFSAPAGAVPRRLRSHYSQIMSWDGQVLTVGGTTGFMHESTQVLRHDADWKVTTMLDGRPVMKIEDHPAIGEPTIHYSDIRQIWFGNTNVYRDGERIGEPRPVAFSYQGATPGYDGAPFTINGQNANGHIGQETICGGDLILQAGNAEASPGSETLVTPGNIHIRGGLQSGRHEGNVVIGNEPPDYLGARGVMFLDEAHTPPQFASPNGRGGVIFIRDGALWFQGGAGTVTMLAPP